MVSSDQLHCCWPGQSWSAETKACAGEPECPAGYLPRDGTCLPPTPRVMLQAPGDLEPRVSVSFSAAEGDQFTVASDEGSCKTPCTLLLRRGKNRIDVSGAARYRTTLVVRTQAPMEVLVEKRNGAAGGIGVASIVAGGLAVAYGYLLVAGSPAAELAPGGVRAPWADANTSERRIGGACLASVGLLVGMIGGSAGLSNAGHNRLTVIEPEAAEGPEVVGLGLAPLGDRGLGAVAAFSF